MGRISVSMYIVHKSSPGCPVGMAMLSTCALRETSNIILCVGQKLRISDYMELYDVIGDTFCPRYLRSDATPLWKILLNKIGFKYEKVFHVSENPEWKEGWFALPGFGIGRHLI